ncbi:hypothetical protein AKO1_010287 [Acrasis kona]|uniref:INO80 complex subunit B-like conserved region domain-containing protein n=1 Tax=Acrasis kona TaxID=1008807 RepID=A0AAW2ZRF7_9EUKA
MKRRRVEDSESEEESEDTETNGTSALGLNQDLSSEEEEDEEEDEEEEEIEEDEKPDDIQKSDLVQEKVSEIQAPTSPVQNHIQLSAKDLMKEKARLKRQQQEEDVKNETIQKLLKKQQSASVKSVVHVGSSRAKVTMSTVGKSYVAANDKGVPMIRHVDNATLGSFLIIPNSVENAKEFLFPK